MSTPSSSHPPSPPLPPATMQALVDRLIDDAAVFPPGNATVADAVAAHRDHRRAWYGDAIGPLLLRASQVPELLEVITAGDDLAVGLVADDGLAGLAAARDLLLDRDDAARLVQVEVAVPAGHPPGTAASALLAQLAFSTQAYLEVRPEPGWLDALDVIAADGAERAKLRTGGTVASAHPPATTVAAFVRACLDRGLAFKLTAGLHHALRTTTPEGFEQHGVLNVLAAVAAGIDGGDEAALADLLEQRGAAPLLAVLAGCDPLRVRAALVSFGCCGVTEPLDELVGLDLLHEEG